MEMTEKTQNIIKTSLKSLKQDYSDINLKAIKGYGAAVYLFETNGKNLVLKKFKSFQPYDSIPFYDKSRVATEVEIYKTISNTLGKEFTPQIINWNKSKGLLLMDEISHPFSLLEERLIDKHIPCKKFFANLSRFLKFKKNKCKILDEKFYTFEDTKLLRSLFVGKKYKTQIDRLFNEGKKHKNSLQLAGLAPKNIFISESRFKVIDFEEAFIGDSIYDSAYFLGHMLIYHIITENMQLLENIRFFVEATIRDFNMTKSDLKRLFSYAGLMILHRAGGFNIKGDFTGKQKDLQKIGESYLYGNDILNIDAR
jgi:5-methylthioribose kinase